MLLHCRYSEMNHFDFMQNKSKRKTDILDYVKNTAKPKKYRGGSGRGTNRVSSRPTRNQPNMPSINLYFNTGGREVLYNQTQPHPYNPQHLPVNIQNAQPNPQAVVGYNAQQRVDITDLRNQQAQMNQHMIRLRDQIQAQAMNPDEQRLLQTQIQQAQQQNVEILQQVRTHNANTADGLTLNRIATDRLRNQLEVGNKIAFHNAIQTLNVGQGYKRATQEELVRDLDAEILSTAQERLLEAMKKQLHQPEPSRGRGSSSAQPPVPRTQQQRARAAGAGASTSDSEEEPDRTVYLSSRPSLILSDRTIQSRPSVILSDGGELDAQFKSPDLQVQDLQGAARGPPSIAQGSRTMPELQLTNNRRGVEANTGPRAVIMDYANMPITELTNSRKGSVQGRQQNDSEINRRLVEQFANQSLGISDTDQEVYNTRLDLFSDPEARHG